MTDSMDQAEPALMPGAAPRTDCNEVNFPVRQFCCAGLTVFWLVELGETGLFMEKVEKTM
ncbi:MAG: hypothetical protein NZ739_00030 [Verrucomicrobiae bacterium]|nr:hypothetical protein [Verrucomicrobiae bacterium]